MILGIDASNIRTGGGLTHLVEVLRVAKPSLHGFERVVVWSGKATLDRIDERPWLCKAHEALLDRSLPHRIYWQCFKLRRLAKKEACDVLFVASGSDASGFRPMVTIHQNLLPFEWRELWRYGWSLMTLKFMALRHTQVATFKKADGVIYLSEYAHDVVARLLGSRRSPEVIVPHGINRRFYIAPRPARRIGDCSAEQPLRLLYVSTVDVYKHQWYVAEAVAQLRSEGVPVALDLVGPAGFAIGRLDATLRRVDPTGKAIRYRGAVPYEQMHQLYAAADIAICASTCETFGQILTEAMAAGLPIACSNRSALPEILAGAGEYFDPEQPAEIAAALRRLIDSPERRAEMAAGAYARAQSFTWEKCAAATFEFLARARRNV